MILIPILLALPKGSGKTNVERGSVPLQNSIKMYIISERTACNMMFHGQLQLVVHGNICLRDLSTLNFSWLLLSNPPVIFLSSHFIFLGFSLAFLTFFLRSSQDRAWAGSGGCLLLSHLLTLSWPAQS